MTKLKKIAIISLTLMVLLAISLTGCNSANPTTATTSTTTTTTQAVSPLSQQELQQLLTDSVNFNKSAKTYKFTMSLNMKATIDGKAGPGDVSMAMDGAADIAAIAMQMNMNMQVPDDNGQTQSQKMKMFLADGYMYINMNVPGVGDTWIKTEATEQILKNFNADIMNEQMDAFASPDSIEFVREDTVRGADCYVLKISPNMEYMRKYAEENASQELTIDWDKVENIQDLYKNMVYLVWIAKDNKEMVKMDISGALEYTSDFAHSNQLSFKSFIVDYGVIAELYDHGATVNIVLPDEAKNATEISPEALTGQ